LRRAEAVGAPAFRLVVGVLVAAGIAGWWYVGNWQRYHVILGPAQMIEVHRTGGLVQGVVEKFSVAAWLRGHAAFVTTLGWSCTWSLARPPYPYLRPLARILLLVASAYAAALRRVNAGALAWLPGSLPA